MTLARTDLYKRLIRELKQMGSLVQPESPARAQRFRAEMTAACGEEPAVLMSGEFASSLCDDLVEVPLSDYLVWFLKTKQAAVYRNAGGTFRKIAGFGKTPAEIAEDSAVTRWIWRNGPLVRNHLTLAGLSAQEAESLLLELDTLDAALISPVLLNDGLWGFILVGPGSAGKPFDTGAALYLNLYGVSLAGCFERRAAGAAARSKTWASEQDRALKEAQELWASFKPRENRVKLLILEEEPQTADSLTRFFRGWGFDAAGVAREEEVLGYLRRFPAHLFLADMNLRSGLSLKTLEAARILAPEAVFFGTATGRPGISESIAKRLGIQRIFMKPCRFAGMAKELFEAALNVSLREDLVRLAEGPESCLIVDQEAEAAQALREYFEARGTRVWTAIAEENALAVAEFAHPSVILLNLTLTAFTRTELIRHIRRISPESRLVVMTTAEEEPSGRTALSGRADAYCPKPVRMERLNQVVGGVYA